MESERINKHFENISVPSGRDLDKDVLFVSNFDFGDHFTSAEFFEIIINRFSFPSITTSSQDKYMQSLLSFVIKNKRYILKKNETLNGKFFSEVYVKDRVSESDYKSRISSVLYEDFPSINIIEIIDLIEKNIHSNPIEVKPGLNIYDILYKRLNNYKLNRTCVVRVFDSLISEGMIVKEDKYIDTYYHVDNYKKTSDKRDDVSVGIAEPAPIEQSIDKGVDLIGTNPNQSPDNTRKEDLDFLTKINYEYEAGLKYGDFRVVSDSDLNNRDSLEIFLKDNKLIKAEEGVYYYDVDHPTIGCFSPQLKGSVYYCVNVSNRIRRKYNIKEIHTIEGSLLEQFKEWLRGLKYPLGLFKIEGFFGSNGYRLSDDLFDSLVNKLESNPAEYNLTKIEDPNLKKTFRFNDDEYLCPIEYYNQLLDEYGVRNTRTPAVLKDQIETIPNLEKSIQLTIKFLRLKGLVSEITNLTNIVEGAQLRSFCLRNNFKENEVNYILYPDVSHTDQIQDRDFDAVVDKINNAPDNFGASFLLINTDMSHQVIISILNNLKNKRILIGRGFDNAEEVFALRPKQDKGEGNRKSVNPEPIQDKEDVSVTDSPEDQLNKKNILIRISNVLIYKGNLGEKLEQQLYKFNQMSYTELQKSISIRDFDNNQLDYILNGGELNLDENSIGNNAQLILDFIKESGYQAFDMYDIRSYFNQLSLVEIRACLMVLYQNKVLVEKPFGQYVLKENPFRKLFFRKTGVKKESVPVETNKPSFFQKTRSLIRQIFKKKDGDVYVFNNPELDRELEISRRAYIEILCKYNRLKIIPERLNPEKGLLVNKLKQAEKEYQDLLSRKRIIILNETNDQRQEYWLREGKLYRSIKDVRNKKQYKKLEFNQALLDDVIKEKKLIDGLKSEYGLFNHFFSKYKKYFDKYRLGDILPVIFYGVPLYLFTSEPTLTRSMISGIGVKFTADMYEKILRKKREHITKLSLMDALEEINKFSAGYRLSERFYLQLEKIYGKESAIKRIDIIKKGVGMLAAGLFINAGLHYIASNPPEALEGIFGIKNVQVPVQKIGIDTIIKLKFKIIKDLKIADNVNAGIDKFYDTENEVILQNIVKSLPKDVSVDDIAKLEIAENGDFDAILANGKKINLMYSNGTWEYESRLDFSILDKIKSFKDPVTLKDNHILHDNGERVTYANSKGDVYLRDELQFSNDDIAVKMRKTYTQKIFELVAKNKISKFEAFVEYKNFKNSVFLVTRDTSNSLNVFLNGRLLAKLSNIDSGRMSFRFANGLKKYKNNNSFNLEKSEWYKAFEYFKGLVKKDSNGDLIIGDKSIKTPLKK